MIPSIIINENFIDAAKAGKFYLNRDKKIDDLEDYIIDTAPLSKIARIVRIDQLVELFERIHTKIPKELLDHLHMVHQYENEEKIYNEENFN